jgi:sodium pump decarboxylase gamma subunit
MSIFEQGLLITAIGMGLVFGVIIFLWGLMALMMRLTSRKTQFEDQDIDEKSVPQVPEMAKAEGQRRAAAAAVAVQMATAGSQARELQFNSRKKKGDLSPWQTVHRLRQHDSRKRRG